MPKPDITEVFRTRLGKAREMLGITQHEVGRRMGLPENTARNRVNRYETGATSPDLHSAKAVADALGVSLSWMVCEDPALASAIYGFSRLPPGAREKILRDIARALREVERSAAPPAPAPPKKKQTRRRVSK